MNLNRLLCNCYQCGGFAQPHALWLSDQKTLVITALCLSCEEKTNVIFPLDVLFKGCPIPDLSQVEAAIVEATVEDQPPKPMRPTGDDKKFLRAMRIVF